MLPSTKNDLLYLLNILESIGKIALYSQDCSDAMELYNKNEQLNLNASLNLLANIGENVGKISAETKSMFGGVEWVKIRGFRNRIVHDYVNVDTFVVMDIIQNELPVLRERLTDIVISGLQNGFLDKAEYDVAKGSAYYKHISFDTINEKLKTE